MNQSTEIVMDAIFNHVVVDNLSARCYLGKVLKEVRERLSPRDM